MDDNQRLFLPSGYVANRPQSADSAGADYWGDHPTYRSLHFQAPVYRLAARRARQLGARVVVDIGTGSGDKFARFFGQIPNCSLMGIDQQSGIKLASRRFGNIQWIAGDLESAEVWTQLDRIMPDLVLCADVIEHVVDPEALLSRLRRYLRGGVLIMSTPDRNLVEGNPPLGPPINPLHVREWTAPEFRKLVLRNGFSVVRDHHLLPREYSLNHVEAARVVRRLLRGQVVPDTRHCQVFELIA